MAKKKKHKRRARRVGGLKLGGNDTLIKLAAVGVGFLAATPINNAIDKILPKDATGAPSKNMQTAATVGQVGIGGLLLLKKGRGTTGMAMNAAGGLLAGASIKRVLKTMGIISGYQSVPVIGSRRHRMAGYQSTPVIGAIPAQLAGTPPQLAGYRPAGSGAMGAYVPAGSGVMGGIGACEPGSGITYSTGSGYMG